MPQKLDKKPRKYTTKTKVKRYVKYRILTKNQRKKVIEFNKKRRNLKRNLQIKNQIYDRVLNRVFGKEIADAYKDVYPILKYQNLKKAFTSRKITASTFNNILDSLIKLYEKKNIGVKNETHLPLKNMLQNFIEKLENSSNIRNMVVKKVLGNSPSETEGDITEWEKEQANYNEVKTLMDRVLKMSMKKLPPALQKVKMVNKNALKVLELIELM